MSDQHHSTRQVLPLSAAVTALRFRRRDWEQSSQVREILDSFNLPQTPKPERTVDHSESIIMHANVIENRMTTGAHVVRQTRVVDHLPTLSVELAVVEPEAYERVVDATLQQDADAALARLESRRAHARRGVRLARKPATAPKAARLSWIWTVIVVSVLVAAGILYSVAPLAR
jgi:hypothetical protein